LYSAGDSQRGEGIALVALLFPLLLTVVFFALALHVAPQEVRGPPRDRSLKKSDHPQGFASSAQSPLQQGIWQLGIRMMFEARGRARPEKK
jgi:hypothetical protein